MSTQQSRRQRLDATAEQGVERASRQHRRCLGLADSARDRDSMRFWLEQAEFWLGQRIMWESLR